MTRATFQGRDTAVEENMGRVQYKRGTLHLLKYELNSARSNLSGAEKRYKRDFHRKISFRSVLKAGNFVYVERPPWALTDAKRRYPGRLDGDITDASRELLPKSEGVYCVPSVSNLVIHIDWDTVTTSTSVEWVTKVATGLCALQSSAATVWEAE